MEIKIDPNVESYLSGWDADWTLIVNDMLREAVKDFEAYARRESFNSKMITITDVGPNKIQAIKAVRNYTGLGLKEAKDVVDFASSGRPQTIEIQHNRNTLPVEQITQIELIDNAIRDLEAVGCKVTGRLDARDIVRFRKKYGSLGRKILSESFDSTNQE